MQRQCSISDCHTPVRSWGWCNKHYERWRRHGDPTGTLRNLDRTVAQRFWSKVRKTETCWLWTACRHPFGYGGFIVNGHKVRAHRWAYEDAYGPIPEGLELDHLCRNRACVRPEHLEVVTPLTNTQRANAARKKGVDIVCDVPPVLNRLMI